MGLIHGKTTGDDLVAVTVDADGHLQLDTLTLPVVILGAGSAEIGSVQARNYGWVSGAFQKDPLRIGYSGNVRQVWANANLSAGTNNVDSNAVPSGDLWHILSLAFQYLGTSPTQVNFQQRDPAVASYNLKSVASPVSGLWYPLGTPILLAPTELLRIQVLGATAGDDLNAAAVGYRIDIDQ